VTVEERMLRALDLVSSGEYDFETVVGQALRDMIEECAEVAERVGKEYFGGTDEYGGALGIAAEIRALKGEETSDD
jgi:hypothetical protein